MSNASLLIQRAYKTELKPTPSQREAFVHHSDVVRFVWNWALGKRQEHYKATGESLKGGDLIKEFRAVRERVWPWTVGVASRAEETAIRNLDKAYKNFFEKRGGFPRFKSRKKGHVSFTFWGVKCTDIHSDAIRLQKIGWVKVKEKGYLPTIGAKINSVTVSERAGRWFVSVQVEEEQNIDVATGEPIGVDVGIKTLVVVSDGRQFANPKALAAAQRKLRRLNKQLARQQKGSGGWQKTKARLAKLHYRIACVRGNVAHEATSAIVGRGHSASERPSVVVIEDLNVRGMTANHCLARAVSDAAFAEVHRQVEYKAAWGRTEILKADRFYPSSKTCSRCGCVNDELTLSDREFVCPDCGFVIDRDLNAAVNLKVLAGKSPESGNAGGETRPEPSRGVVEFSEKPEPLRDTMGNRYAA